VRTTSRLGMWRSLSEAENRQPTETCRSRRYARFCRPRTHCWHAAAAIELRRECRSHARAGVLGVASRAVAAVELRAC
jgi:hypothetical protein